MAQKDRFAFGRNWKSFLDASLNPETVATAEASLQELTGLKSFEGRSFLDIGCGSGLFSLAAWRLGARPLVSFDYDDDSVACCRALHEAQGSPQEWSVGQGSVLDKTYLDGLGTFDVVYSWGVLHHTGSMWEAIENATTLVKPGGLLSIAIYNKARAVGIYPDGRFGPSGAWTPIKRWFCRLPDSAQNVVTSLVLAFFALTCVVRLRNPMKEIRSFGTQRGMSLRIDIKDWLGGLPYEYADPEEIFTFLRARGYTLEVMRFHDGLRCNEYTFKAPG